MRITIIGGGAGGLFAALLLARSGHQVTLLEQDRLGPAADAESAAAVAYRPSAPQIVQPHAVMARCRELLCDRLPDVYDSLLAAGVVAAPISDWMPDTLADRSPWPGDDRLTPLMTRRSTLDWVLQKAVLTQPGVTVRDNVRAVGLVTRPGRPPHVIGLRTDQGPLSSDLAIDATGRHTPIDRWLAEIGTQPTATRSAECGVTYFSRYRVRPGTVLPGPRTTRTVAGLDEFTLAVFGADNGAMQLALVPLAADSRFRRLKDPDVFTAVLRTIPACESWLQALDPISAVFQMTGPRNTLRRLVVDGDPVVTGLHAIGDSVCTTNPTFGRGLSLAMWGAADLSDIIDKHADNSSEQALALDQRIAEHVAPYYQEQAAVDAARLTTLRHTVFGDPAPPAPPFDSDRITFTQLRVAASYDPTAFRAFWKLMFMLSLPDDVYRDPRIVTCAKDALKAQGLKALQPRGHLDPRIASPTSQQLLEALATSSAHIRSRPSQKTSDVQVTLVRQTPIS